VSGFILLFADGMIMVRVKIFANAHHGGSAGVLPLDNVEQVLVAIARQKKGVHVLVLLRHHGGQNGAFAPSQQRNPGLAQPLVGLEKGDDGSNVLDLNAGHNLAKLYPIDRLVERWRITQFDTALAEGKKSSATLCKLIGKQIEVIEFDGAKLPSVE